ncbi:D-alanyl-D-alanine carboxypeptidase family protein [Fructilactobacillus sanfranciscensis]|uniref:D-alanyl-D-alanine carboxypeptidase family protein n=1 Tax=Fructilactobacillus sanfranciscensis TaxID=1625 RepID=UPI0013D3B346|nr:serine hydrolase [Fructilactobacillus sanfranciscensis]NDR97541.1 D-alanyl-D-alanine carboxypeptidase [Fructilactobacillus sanfranciscensis]
MKFNTKKIKLILAVLGAFFVLNTGISVKAAIFTPNVQSKAAILVNKNTGQVIASKNDQKRYPIASISKLLVIYMVEQQIHQGKLKRTDVVKIPDNILKFSQDSGVANVAMNKQNKYTVDDLEKAALLPSSNSAAMALAEKVSGSQANYYKDAEKLLNSWGIKNVKIYSASGLCNGDMGQLKDKSVSKSAENKLSAREVAIVASKLLAKYPNVLNTTQLTQTGFPSINGGKQQINTTIGLLGHSNYGFKGLKTGTYLKGYNFVGFATLKNQPVITVIFNSRHASPFLSTESMMNQANASTETINNSIKKTKIDNADTKSGEIAIKQKIPTLIFAPNNFKQKDLRINFKQTDDLSAPLKKNDLVGTQTFKFKEKTYNDFIGKQSNIKYVSKNNVDKTWMIVSWYRKLVNLF